MTRGVRVIHHDLIVLVSHLCLFWVQKDFVLRVELARRWLFVQPVHLKELTGLLDR